MKRIVALLLAVVMLLGVLSGCQSKQDPPADSNVANDSVGTGSDVVATVEPKVLNIGLNSNIVGLDPLNTNSNSSRAFVYAVFETLIEYDHQGLASNFTPCLATEWSVDDTGCIWTFKIREGVTFHNGEPLTSADVVTTYQRLLDDTSLALKSAFWAYLQSVEAVDDYTVNITTKEPYAAFLISVAMTPIIPDEAYAQYGEEFWNNQMLYGTGPWKFDEWVDGAYLRMVWNDDYWNKEFTTNVSEINFRFLTEVSTAIAAHVSGDLDAYIVNGGIDAELLPMYTGYDNIELVTTETQNFIYLGFNCSDDSAFSDKLVRQAVDYAIDRDLLCATIYSGNARVTNSVVQPTMAGYDATIPAYEYNPQKAADLLAQSSYDNHEITLYTSNSLGKGKDQCLAISEMLNAVGFNTRVEAMESAAFTELRKSANYEVFLMNDQPMGGDLAKYFSQKILSDAHKHEYDNAALMDLADKILTELDPETRLDYLAQAARMMREEAAPHTILYYLVQTQAINKGVVGFQMYSDTCYNVKYIDFDATLAN